VLAQATAVSDPLGDLVRRRRAGERIGITSLCSAHPLVLEAGVIAYPIGSAGGTHGLGGPPSRRPFFITPRAR
jgi:hypothetical protein